MNGCKYIRERIDEAEKPDLLSFEVTQHISQCDECERFAFERAALRNLVAEGARVSAPLNFDAVLRARLEEVKARPSFWWLGSPGYFRLGAATAGLVVMIFAAQYSGLFSDEKTKPLNEPQRNAVAPNPPPLTTPAPPEVTTPIRVSPTAPSGLAVAVNRYRGASRVRRGDAVEGIPVGYFTAETGGVVLVRGSSADMDFQVPTVSVGAQPLLYVSAGQRAGRSVGTSF